MSLSPKKQTILDIADIEDKKNYRGYFIHYEGARNDIKLKRASRELGSSVAYAGYFKTLEVLKESDMLYCSIDDIDLLSDEFEISEQMLRVLILNYGLFEIVKLDDNQIFFSTAQVQSLKPLIAKREQARLAGIKSGQSRRAKSKSNQIENQPNERSTNVEPVKERKGKESINNNKKKEEIYSYINNQNSKGLTNLINNFVSWLKVNKQFTNESELIRYTNKIKNNLLNHDEKTINNFILFYDTLEN